MTTSGLLGVSPRKQHCHLPGPSVLGLFALSVTSTQGKSRHASPPTQHSTGPSCSHHQDPCPPALILLPEPETAMTCRPSASCLASQPRCLQGSPQTAAWAKRCQTQLSPGDLVLPGLISGLYLEHTPVCQCRKEGKDALFLLLKINGFPRGLSESPGEGKQQSLSVCSFCGLN